MAPGARQSSSAALGEHPAADVLDAGSIPAASTNSCRRYRLRGLPGIAAAPTAGLEPAAFRSGTGRSVRLSYAGLRGTVG